MFSFLRFNILQKYVLSDSAYFCQAGAAFYSDVGHVTLKYIKGHTRPMWQTGNKDTLCWACPTAHCRWDRCHFQSSLTAFERHFLQDDTSRTAASYSGHINGEVWRASSCIQDTTYNDVERTGEGQQGAKCSISLIMGRNNCALSLWLQNRIKQYSKMRRWWIKKII